MRALPAAALALAVLLAGCAEEPSAPPAAPTGALVVTDANDEEALTNETFRMQEHQHDYWGGKDRLVVLDATKEDGTFYLADEWSTALLPEDGVVVPQGTARVEVVVSWADGENKRYARPELWVRTAADHVPRLVGAVENGQTLVVETDLPQADLPHQSLSAWRFEWRIHPPDDPIGWIWWDGSVTMKAEAVRGREIPVYPPHPDAWGDAERILLLDEGQDGDGFWMGDADGDFNCFRQCPATHHPANGSVVPYDAAMVEIEFVQGADSATTLGLRYHPANARAWVEPTPDETDGARRVYRIPVETGMGDSPYATQSLWEIQPFVQGPSRDSAKVGSYRLTMTVMRTA